MYPNNNTASTLKYSVSEERESNINFKRNRRQSKIWCYKVGANVPARLVLYFLSWSGFLVSFMMRNDINFALVAMTRSTENSNETGLSDMDNNIEWKNNSIAQLEIVNLAQMTNRSSTIIPNGIDMYKYAWSSTVKSVIISAFYWCYVLSQVVGGLATQYFGTKSVFGWSQFITAMCSLLIPSASDLHYTLVIALRSIQGFASGLTWPAMYAIVGYWIPLAERSRFMSSFQGFSIGIGLTYPLCGFVVNNFGWRYVFYTTGTLGSLWCLLWYFLAFNTPKKHPRITQKELNFIEENVSAEVKDTLGLQVPWIQIFTSLPAWAIGITTFGRIWIHYIFIVSGPTFIKSMLKFDYEANGLLSGMPFICSYISSVLFCYIADKMTLYNVLSLTNVRKIFTALSQVIPGLLLYWIGYIQDITLLLVVYFISVTFITASYAGAMANIVDIAPNLAGSVLAFCQTIHMSAAFISPLVAGMIVTQDDSIAQWRTVFGVSSIVTILTYIVYHIYGTADIQKWNNLQPKLNELAEESRTLKTQNDKGIPKI